MSLYFYSRPYMACWPPCSSVRRGLAAHRARQSGGLGWIAATYATLVRQELGIIASLALLLPLK